MATRKVKEDPGARVEAEELLSKGGNSLSLFPSAEFETTTSRVGGEELTLRRVTLTSAWEVVASPQ